MYIPTYTTYLCMLSIRSKNMGNSHLILCQSSSFVWTNDIATTWNNKLTFIKQFLFRIIWVTNKDKSMQAEQISRNTAAVCE